MTNNAILTNKVAHDEISEYYDLRHDEIFNDKEQERLSQVIEKLVKKIGKKKCSVLDYGAGTGNLSLKFLKKNCWVTAIDISKNELALLQKLSRNNPKLKTLVFDGITIPEKDNTYDVVATYSVLHHIPNYLAAVEDMLRVTKKGGYLLIDHEANENKWKNDPHLKEYQKLTKKSTVEIFVNLCKTGEIFLLSFWKSLFTTLLVNKRHRREGDLHVWHDDHIEWNKIKQILKNKGKIITEKDYLLYKPKGGQKIYEIFKKQTSDTKLFIFQKS